MCLLLPGLVLAQGSGAQSTGAQTPRFRSSVDLVSVAAVVRDRKGRLVADLSRDDFVIVEDGERRNIVRFETEVDAPVRVALVMDVSGSMRVGTRVADAQQAVRHLLGALKAGDEAALFTFDTRLEQVQGFTSDFARVAVALDVVDPPYGQTSLYDAIAETARVAAESRPETGMQRTAVVVLTDGVDTNSRLTPPQVSWIASSIDVPVYVLAVMSSSDDARRSDSESAIGAASSALEDLARWSGGALFTSSAPAHASMVTRQIVDELRHQYLLAFEASARPGWKALDVRARQRDHVVRARSGYIVGGSRTEQ